MRIRLTAEAFDWFEGHNVSFHNRFGIRLKPGDPLLFLDDLEVEPFIGIHGGNTMCAMGFMSFTNSAVPFDLEIGRYCSLAPNLRFPRYRHPIEHLSTSIFTHDRETDLVIRFARDQKVEYQNFFKNPQKHAIRIEHDVWIGAGAALLQGITIGTGSVVAAHSVVSKSVGPYEVVGGNPCRLIRPRFAPETVCRLLASEWWKYKFTDFSTLRIDDPVRFLDAFERLRPTLVPYNPAKVKVAEVAKFL